MVASTEIDVRLLGMVVALAVIWIGFHVLSGGDFLTARNLWNLSVQSASIAIMATGMVLIIVSRNIDLSVGSLLGFLGYTMALVQTDGILSFFGVDLHAHSLVDKSYAWMIALTAAAVTLGSASWNETLRFSVPLGCSTVRRNANAPNSAAEFCRPVESQSSSCRAASTIRRLVMSNCCDRMKASYIAIGRSSLMTFGCE